MATLLIDDVKNLPADRVARTFNEGIAALQEQHWDVLLLDHDLADFTGPEGRERNGYHVLCWLEANPEHLPGDIVIVSANGGGIPHMRLTIKKLYGRLF